MLPILHFRKEFSAPPVTANAMGVHVRSLDDPDDILAWISLRQRAMAGQSPAVRTWCEMDFRNEMLNKRWWTPGCTWLAIDNQLNSVIGAVTMAMREGATGAVPVVHWLLVDPAFRRRGIGRTLMSRLEHAAWDAGWREVQLETHAGWAAAVAFYQSIGYAPVRERSPR